MEIIIKGKMKEGKTTLKALIAIILKIFGFKIKMVRNDFDNPREFLSAITTLHKRIKTITNKGEVVVIMTEQIIE